MKHNLLLSYSTFLIFYLLLKVEGQNVKNHPVVYKLAHIKTLFSKLQPVDDKIKIEVERILNSSDAAEEEDESSEKAAAGDGDFLEQASESASNE